MQKQSRFEKSVVVQNIVDAIHGRGGRFLKQDSRTGKYTIELSMTQSREKVGHAIRDASNLHASRQRASSERQMDTDEPNVPSSMVDPTTAAAKPPPESASRKPSAKRPRQLPPPSSRGSLGSTSSIFSLAVVDDLLSPMSGRDSRINHLLQPSPIQYSSNMPPLPLPLSQQQQQRQQERPGYFYYDPSSPSTSTTSLYQFDPLVPSNQRNNDIDLNSTIMGGTAAFPALLLQQSQLTPNYPIDPQLYQQRQQLRQQLYQQQQPLQQQQSGGSDSLYSNYPSQQLARYNIPIPQPSPQPPQQRPAVPITADTILPPKMEPAMGTASTSQPPNWIRQRPFLSSSYEMLPQHVTEPPNVNTGSNLDAYTQILFREQQERFYRDYHVSAPNRPPVYTGQNLPPPPQRNDDNDVFLEAIDSVLGPMDPDNNDGLAHTQLPIRTFDDGSISLDPQRRTERSVTRQQQPPIALPGELDSPTDSMEDQNITASYPPTSHRPAR